MIQKGSTGGLEDVYITKCPRDVVCDWTFLFDFSVVINATPPGNIKYPARPRAINEVIF